MRIANKKRMQLQSGSHARGFGLVELMVAMTIGLVVLGGIGYVYLGSRQTFRTQDDFSRIQENVRFVLDQVGVDVRMAGYSGCVNVSSINPVTPGQIPLTPVGNQLSQSIQGYLGAATWPGPATAPANYVANTDVLRVTSASVQGVNVTGTMASTSGAIAINGNPAGFATGNTLVISDCVSADVFAAGTVTGTAVTPAAALSKIYSTGAEVSPLVDNVYFIGTNAAGNPSLYWIQNGGTAQELVENVENMVLRFGIDTDNNFIVDSYVSPGAITWRQVLTVRMNLVLRGNSNNIATQLQPYVVEYTSITPTDRRLRQVATATYGLRNRLP